MSFSDLVAADARLCILKELSKQTDGRLNDLTLLRVLDAYGFRRPQNWVRTQLRALDALDAINVTDAGTVMIASLTKLGRDHVERRQIVEGITRPSDED
ncbi:MAG: hypothetical protein V4808_07150 [Pseudomonadota bacterium]